MHANTSGVVEAIEETSHLIGEITQTSQIIVVTVHEQGRNMVAISQGATVIAFGFEKRPLKEKCRT